MNMLPHHTQSIRNLVHEMEGDPSVDALLLGGSLAHGFAGPQSDIDVMIVVPEAEFQRRQQTGLLHYNNTSLCTYEGGYIDGKFLTVGVMRDIIRSGGDAARFAFKNCRVLYSRVDGIEELLSEIVRFPVEEKRNRIERFGAQLLAWRWYFSEGRRRANRYVELLAVQKLVLFGCRIVLTINESLFPYHKWLLRVVESQPHQPTGFGDLINSLLESPTVERVEDYAQRVFAFAGVDIDQANATWPTRFMRDTELAWMRGEPPIDDL